MVDDKVSESPSSLWLVYIVIDSCLLQCCLGRICGDVPCENWLPGIGEYEVVP